MLWRCEFSPLGHGIFWWNTGNPQQGYIILPCALSLVSRVTEVHHMFKDHTENHLNSWGEEGEINSKESGSFCHMLSTRHSTVFFTQRRTGNETMWEAQAEEVREVAHFSPYSLSGRTVPLLNSPLWMVLTGGDCVLAVRMLSSTDAHPHWPSSCPSLWASGGLPADRLSDNTASLEKNSPRVQWIFAADLCVFPLSCASSQSF